MRRPSPLAGLFLVIALAGPSWAASPETPFDRAYADAFAKVAKAFLEGKPVDQAWSKKDLETLAVRPPFAPGKSPEAQKLGEFSALVGRAKKVQEAKPPQDAADYALDVRKAAIDLKLVPEDQAKAKQLYLSRLKTPKDNQQLSAAQLEQQRAQIQAMLADPHISAERRAALTQRSQQLAAALGSLRMLDAPNAAVPAGAWGAGGALTPEEIRRLNAVPPAQRPGAAKAPPAVPPRPSREELQRRALAEAEKVVKENPGTVGEAYNYWDDVDKDKKSHWWITRMYAKVNKGLLTVSGLRDVEESAGKLGYVWDDERVSGGQKAWMGTKLGGNMALSAATFLPAASFAKSVKAGEGFYWIGKGGAAVPGLVKAAPKAAEAMTAASGEVATVVRQALPQGEKIAAGQLPGLFTKLNQMGARYGVVIEQGGTLGESTAQGGKIFANLGLGAHHESVHAVQQFYTRVMSLERVAAQSGTTVEALTAAQRAQAFAQAARFEAASYAQFEAQAWRATGFMGSFPGKGYTTSLLAGGGEISSALKNGTVVAGRFAPGAVTYGRLTQILGHSQAEIGAGMGALSASVINVQKPEIAEGADTLMYYSFPKSISPTPPR